MKINLSKLIYGKYRPLFIVVTFFALGILLATGYRYIKGKSQKDSGLPQNAILTLESDKTKVSAGETFNVILTLNSGESEVAAADIVVHYDSQFVKVVSVSPGTFFASYPINITGDDYIKISGVASFDGQTLILPKGKDTVATITFQAISKGRAVIKYNQSKTIVATAGENIVDENKLSKMFITVQ